MSNLDKNKVYCSICNKELKFNKSKYEYQCNCYDNRRFKYVLKWCKHCLQFTSRRGVFLDSKCCRCAVILQHKTMKEQDPEGYSQRQANATRKANEIMKKERKGVWGKEQHIQAENTKRKNGTDFGNQEFRKKIGCNGNPQEVQDKLKQEKSGIYSDKCLELKTQRFNDYWKTDEWKKSDKIRKQQIVKNQWTFKNKIKCNNTCNKLNDTKCDKSCLKNIYGLCKEKQIEMSGMKLPNFITKNNVRYYKNIEVREFAQKILNHELNISDYPGINIRYGRVCYGTEDILTSEKLIKNNSNFEEKDDVLYFYNRTNQDYVSWEEYKLKFSRMRTTSEINHFIKKLKSLEIFQPKSMGPVDSYDLDDTIKLYPTFRSQKSNDWTGAKGAFEQSLVDNNVNWFCYIKFYIDRNDNIRPLVVGKSGSLNVNNNGSDVSFSTDINDGPARKFLNDENLQWDKTQILIIKAKSERQALFYEWKIADVYELFES